MEKTYTYYFRIRPPAIGTHPKNPIQINENSMTVNNRDYWGSATYDRPLTQKELYDYDLDEKPKSKKEIEKLYIEFLNETFDNDQDQVQEFMQDKQAFDHWRNEIMDR